MIMLDPADERQNNHGMFWKHETKLPNASKVTITLMFRVCQHARAVNVNDSKLINPEEEYNNIDKKEEHKAKFSSKWNELNTNSQCQKELEKKKQMIKDTLAEF